MKFRLVSLIVLSLLLFTFVSANDNIDYSNETQNITFHEIIFSIPEGFVQSKDAEDFDELGSNGQTCFYVDETEGEIVITVISDWMGMNVDELYKDGAEEFVINGHQGWKYKEDGLHYFGYVQDNKGILVGVTNTTRLYEVIL